MLGTGGVCWTCVHTLMLHGICISVTHLEVGYALEVTGPVSSRLPPGVTLCGYPGYQGHRSVTLVIAYCYF